MDRIAVVAFSELVNKALNCPAGVDYTANGVLLVANLLRQSCGYPYNIRIIERLHHNECCRRGNGSEEW